MSQVLSQDSPLQNCTNTFNFSPLSSRDVSINLITPNKMRRQPSDDFIDLTLPKLKSPLIISERFIDEIVISDSDDESPPKRVKNSETPFYTPKRFKSTPNLFKKTISPLQVRSYGLQTKLYQSPILTNSPKDSLLKRTSSATTIPIKCHTPQPIVKHSTPVSDLLPTPLSTHESPGTLNGSMRNCPRLTPIKPTKDTRGCFSHQLSSFDFDVEEELLPTDVTTVELFASRSDFCTASSETSRNVTLKTANTKFVRENSLNSLPEMNFIQIDTTVPSVSSQLAEKLKTVAFGDKRDSLPSVSIKTEFFTPKCEMASDDQYFTPFRSSPSPPPPVTAPLTLERLENNWRCYTRPNHPTKFLSDTSVEGKEVSHEWIDGTINLPLESQTSFVKMNSLQLVRSCISTPHIKISKFLLTPLVTHLLTSQDVNIIIQTANLLCDVIKTHPAATMDNTDCYREVFTWDLLNSSIETLCSGVYMEAALHSILRLYCDVIESEISYYKSTNSSYTRYLFWPKSSCVCLSDILKDLIEYTYRLFSKQCPIIYRLSRLFEVILDWSVTSQEVLWHEQAAYEFHNKFSKLKSEDYSLFIQIISRPWFAGYIAQIRLREIGVPSLHSTPLSSNLKEFFTTHSNFLPTHTQERLQQASANTTQRAQLIKASKYGECRIIKQIIRDGCDPNICNEKNWNPILRACCSGNVCSIEAIVEACIENNTPVNIVQINGGATPLHLAAKFDNFDVCLCLLKMGGPSLLLHRDKDGYFPFEVATLPKLVKLLRIDYEEDKIDRRSASKGFNTNLRIPIDTNIIIEFESMVCTALNGLFVKGGFDTDDVTACQQAHLFVQKLTSQINRSQTQPVELTRLAALISSYFV